MKNYGDEIAASMDAYLQNPEHQKMFGVNPLNKQASAPEITDADIEISDEVIVEPSNVLEYIQTAGKMDSDSLVKSAFNKLMEASEELEDAGYEILSANALVLVDHLVKEAKAKKEKMSDKDKAKLDKVKAKEKFEKMKMKEKAEKDKNEARDKKMKDKEKEKEKMMKEREDQRNKLNKMQEKANKTKKE